MSRLIRHQELYRSLRRRKDFQGGLYMRLYHLEPGEENLCVVAKSTNDLEMATGYFNISHNRHFKLDEVNTHLLIKISVCWEEVLIRVGSCCLSTFDYDYFTRFYGKDRSLYSSMVLGSFGTGIVIKTGAGVTEAFTEGDRVAMEPGIFCNQCNNCKAGKTNLCHSISYLGSTGRNGTLCRFINHPTMFTHKLDKGVSLEVGTLATKIAGCIHSYKRAGITKDSKVLIMGTSLIGLVFIIVIKHLGVGSVFVTETNNYRLKLAKNFGADYIIKMTSLGSPEYPEYLKEIMDSVQSGEPDIVIDTIGSAWSLESSFNLTKSGGRILLLNLMARPIAARFHHSTLREIDIIGSFTYNHESFKEAIKFLTNENIPLKKILPVKIPLERALDAFSHGRATGGENLFILVNSFNETVEISKPISSSDESKTAGIPSLTSQTVYEEIQNKEKLIKMTHETINQSKIDENSTVYEHETKKPVEKSKTDKKQTSEETMIEQNKTRFSEKEINKIKEQVIKKRKLPIPKHDHKSEKENKMDDMNLSKQSVEKNISQEKRKTQTIDENSEQKEKAKEHEKKIDEKENNINNENKNKDIKSASIQSFSEQEKETKSSNYIVSEKSIPNKEKLQGNNVKSTSKKINQETSTNAQNNKLNKIQLNTIKNKENFSTENQDEKSDTTKSEKNPKVPSKKKP